MYLPRHFAVEDRAAILGLLRRSPFGHLVTIGAVGGVGALASTPLPFVIDDQLTAVRAHFSRANDHWRTADGVDALFIVPGADAYVSPRWYPTKAATGKVVPTWNYEVVHIHGRLSVHDDAAWKRNLVGDLTDHNERQVDDPDAAAPWAVSDAPGDFIDGQLRAIVGVELTVTAIEAKQKLSQNRSAQDRDGAALGLSRSDRPGDVETAAAMEGLDQG